MQNIGPSAGTGTESNPRSQAGFLKPVFKELGLVFWHFLPYTDLSNLVIHSTIPCFNDCSQTTDVLVNMIKKGKDMDLTLSKE